MDLKSELDYMDFNCMRWNGEPKLNEWKVPELAWVNDEFSSPQDQIADMTKFLGGAIALSGKAHAVLAPLLGPKAEFLPVECQGEPWYLLNVTNVQPVMDSARSKFKIYEDGHIGPCTHAYINEPVGEDADIFLAKGYFPNIFISGKVKTAIEEAGLTGSLIREYLNPK